MGVAWAAVCVARCAALPTVSFQSLARPLLVFHALAAVALLGACTHLVVVCARLLKGRTQQARLARLYCQVIGGTFVSAFIAGLLLYPSYRYHVRALFLDRYEPWASNLFDMKENFAALGLPVALMLWFSGKGLTPEAGPGRPRLLAFLALLLWGCVAMAVLSGLVVTSVRGMG